MPGYYWSESGRFNTTPKLIYFIKGTNKKLSIIKSNGKKLTIGD